MFHFNYCLLFLRLFIASASFCCSSTSSNCGACESEFLLSICSTERGCVEQCRGIFCNDTLATVNDSCVNGINYGIPIPFRSILVPAYLVSMGELNASLYSGRRLLVSRHFVGVMRTMPFPIGTIAAAATPEYDQAPASSLASELVDANNRIAALSDTVADLANKTIIETELRERADRILLAMAQATNDNLNAHVSRMRSVVQSLSVTASLTAARVAISEQAALYLDAIANNRDRANEPITSPVVQKFLRIASLAEFDPEFNFTIDSDNVTFLAKSDFMHQDDGSYDDGTWDSERFTCSQFTEVTVIRRNSPLTYLGGAGDTYIYEVTQRPVSFPVSRIFFGVGGAGNCGDSPSCRTLAFAYCLDSAANWRLNCSLSENASHTFIPTFRPGVSQESNTTCMGLNATTCVPSAYRRCDDTDIIGPRPTVVFLPSTFSDIYHAQLSAKPFSSPATVPTSLTGVPYYTNFFDPIYIAKKLFPAKNSTLPIRVQELLDGANRQDNIVFGKYGPQIELPVGLLPGTLTPVVIDPDYFAASFNIIAHWQGSVPLGGWSPTTGCTLGTSGNICCTDIPVSGPLSFIANQLGFNGSNLPVEYVPRNLFNTLLGLQIALGISGNESNYSIPGGLINALRDIENETTSLRASLVNISQKASDIANASRNANDRIDNLTSSRGVGVAALVLVILLIVIAICVAYCCCQRLSATVKP